MAFPEAMTHDGAGQEPVTQSTLHLILHTGARRHYFPKCKTEVDRIVESIRME